MGVGPIDMALWDIAGKLFDVPIHKLLGGYKESVMATTPAAWIARRRMRRSPRSAATSAIRRSRSMGGTRRR